MAIFYVTVIGECMTARQQTLNDVADRFFKIPVGHPHEKGLLEAMALLMRMSDNEFEYRIRDPQTLAYFLFGA